MSLDGAGGGVSVSLSAAASRSLLFFVASADTRLFREGAAGASWASGLAGWLAGKGVSGVVAHASSNKVALQRIRHRVWFMAVFNGLIFIFKGRHLTRNAELRHGEQVREPGQCSHPVPTPYQRGGNARWNCSFRPFQRGCYGNVAVSAITWQIHVAPSARSMCSLSQSRSGSWQVTE
jgi:hypothetical protein